MKKLDYSLMGAAALLFTLMLLQWSAAKALTIHEVKDLRAADERNYFSSCLLDPGQYDSMNLREVSKASLSVICHFAWKHEYKVRVHSSLRGDALQLVGTLGHNSYRKSRHNIGMALDVSFVPLWGIGVPLSKRTKLVIYRENIVRFDKFLHDLGIAHRVTRTCYPDQNNPFFHVDCRGDPASWGRIKSSGHSYVGYATCIKWIDNQLKSI